MSASQKQTQSFSIYKPLPLHKSSPVRRTSPANVFLAKFYRMADIAIAVSSPVCAFLLTNVDTMPSETGGFLAMRITIKNLLLVGLFTFSWSNIFRAFGLYEQRRLAQTSLLRLIAACTCGNLFAFVFVVTSRAGKFQYSAVAISWLISTALVITARLVMGSLFKQTILSKNPRHVLIVGSGGRALKLYRELTARASDNYHILGFVDSADARVWSREIRKRIIGDLSQLENILAGHVVDEVLITLPIKSCYMRIHETIQTCERLGVESKYLAELFQPTHSRVANMHLDNFTLTSSNRVQHDVRIVIKRGIDLAGAGIGLIVLSPLMLLIAICIRFTGDGKAIFSQERYGFNKRRFRMYKFRTMVSNAEELQKHLEHRNEGSGPTFKIKNDPRVTRIGRILRRTSLDELPQLFNVLAGEMSLVGPRPLPLRDVSRLEEAWLLRRFSVVPGLTCLWQINGRSNTSFDKWVEQDLKYIEHWSLLLDLQILAKTIPAVLKGSGAV